MSRARVILSLRRITIVAAALLALLLAGNLWRHFTAPTPPAIAFGDVDPAVVAAIETAQGAVRASPHSAAAWGRLGQVLLAHRFETEAALCFERAEQLDADDPRWPYLHGWVLRSAEPETAVAYLRRAVDRCGFEPDAPALALAEVYLQLNRLDEAEQLYGQVLQRDAHNARAQLGLGRLRFKHGDLPASLRHLNESAASKLTQKSARTLLAQVHHQLGDDAGASRERARTLDLPSDPPWPDPYLEEAQALRVGRQARLDRLQTLHRQGRLDEARALAARLEDDYPDIYWLVEGREQKERGQLDAAEQALRKALELAPDSVDARFDLGTVLFERADYRAAAECFRRVTEMEPGHAPAHVSLGRCLARLGEREQASRAFRTALRLQPSDARAKELLKEVSGEP